MNTKKSAYKHQMEAVLFLLKRKRALLADDMGLGKTLSSILAMQQVPGRKLIVCPASLKLNWQKEILSIFPKANVVVLEGLKLNSIRKNTWVIVNYDALHTYMPIFRTSVFSVACFDEVHYCKSVSSQGKATSKRAKYCLALSNKIEYVFCLTGTPIPSKTKDVFNILKMIKHPLSKNFKSFAQRYCNPIFNGYGWSYEGSSHQSELFNELKPYMIRRLKTDVLELPDKIRGFIPVDISLSLYNKQLSNYLNTSSSLSSRGQHLVHLNAMRHSIADAKVPHTIRLAQDSLEQHEPIIIFTNFDSVVHSLLKAFKEAAVITGKQNAFERNRAVEDFQKGATRILICNLMAGGLGLTLTRGNRILVNDLDWVPANHLQAEDRIYRIGQDKNCVIHYLYAPNSIDEKMTLLLETKLRNIHLVIDDVEMGFVDEVMEWILNKKNLLYTHV